MSYAYSTGNGISVLLTTEPAGTEPYANVAPAVRQIKAYLNDSSVGPAAKLSQIETALTALTAAISTAGTAPVGIIAFRGADGDMEASGWLICDGRAISRTTYATLFAVIGVTYGPGNNIDTFNLPGVNGRALLGYDQGRGVLREDPANPASPLAGMGKSMGTHRVVLTEANLPVHDHTIAAGPTYPNNYYVEADGAYNANSPATGPRGGGFNLPESGQAGNSESHQNNQPSLALPCYIKFR